MPSVKPKNRDAARSRNTTPISTGHHDAGTASASPGISTMSYDEVLDKYCHGSNPPASVQLKKIAEALKICSDIAKQNSDSCDKGMRELSRRRKEVLEMTREEEMRIREENERKERQRQFKLKQEPPDDSRPLAIGAHSLAPQDGSAPNRTSNANGVNGDKQNGGASPAHTASSDDSHQPPPAPPLPAFQTFGPDPTTFNDPTIYHIRELHDGLTEKEKKEILQVAHYPPSDLHDLTPGTPPDRDFSNAKPPNQVSVTAFINYLEPFVRSLTQEDIGFLEERGDRVNPMLVPRRGDRSYKEVWAAEDSNQFFADGVLADTPSQNQPSGSMEDMNDELAETNAVSTGPMMARLLSLLKPEPRTSQSDGGNTNGDVAMNGTSERDGTAEPSIGEHNSDATRPPTYMPESQQPGWKQQLPKQDYGATDERIKQELIYMGFLTPDARSDYDGHHDDEVAARLRYLQEELQRVSIINGARKARLLDLVQERMAQQEWSTIADDLDTQINQAYLKRHRNIGKSKGKLKRPGGPGGGSHPAGAGAGVSKPSIGEPIKALMHRRDDWRNLIGPVVDFGHATVPTETIFDQKTMDDFMAKEREQWADAVEQG